jgi:hypothetical protein
MKEDLDEVMRLLGMLRTLMRLTGFSNREVERRLARQHVKRMERGNQESTAGRCRLVRPEWVQGMAALDTLRQIAETLAQRLQTLLQRRATE